MILSTIHEIKNIPRLKEAGADALIFGLDELSIRACRTFLWEQLPEIKACCERYQVKLYINALRFFMEDEMDLVRRFLKLAKELSVDGIYYGDEGFYQEAKAIGFEDRLVYQPETLITNSSDIDFYLGLGIQSVSLAHECTLEEIAAMTRNQKNVEVLISGYFSILYSRRPLLTNYKNQIHSNQIQTDRMYTLIESTRTARMPILEDRFGTTIYSEAPIQSFKELPILKEHGLSRFRIDSLFFDDEWTIQVLQAYKTKGDLPGSNRWYYQKTMTKKEEGDV